MIPRIQFCITPFVMVLITVFVSVISLPSTSFAQNQTTWSGAASLNAVNSTSIQFLPYINRAPTAPTIHINQNTFTPTYQVKWIPAQDSAYIEMYIVEESNDGFRSHVNRVYEGPDTSWQSPHKYPGTYSYRVSALVKSQTPAVGAEYVGYTPWSRVHSYTIWPLFVGLQVSWQGVGYIHQPSVSQFREIDYSLRANFVEITQDDIVRSNWTASYQHPEWNETDTWEGYYSITTGSYLSSTYSGNPNFKWGEPYRLSYGHQLAPSKETLFAGKSFEITGPHSGVTVYGRTIRFWRLTNIQRILYHDGGAIKQYVEPGNLVLAYDAGPSGLLIHSNVIRRVYRNGHATDDTIHYIVNLHFSNAIDHATVASMVEDSGIEFDVDTYSDRGMVDEVERTLVPILSNYVWRANGEIEPSK